MASPSLVSQEFSLSAGLTDTSFSPTLSAHAAGDMLEVDVGVDGNVTVTIDGGSGGWSLDWQIANTTGSTTPTMAKLHKLAASSSESLTVGSGAVGEAWAASCRVYRGAGGTLNYFTASGTNGSGTDGQGNAISPGVGSQDFTFTQCMVMDGTQGTNAAPTGYTNYQTNNNAAAARVDVSTAELAATASSDTPAAWDSNAEQWIVGGGAVWETASGGESQSIAFTLEDVSVEVSQTATHPQELAATLDGVSVSIAQTVQHPQALAITLDDVVVAIEQSVSGGASQSIAFTLAGVTVDVEQTASHAQSMAMTLDGVTVAIEQGAQHAQALTATLDGVAVEIQQDFSVPEKDQALAITLDGVLVSINQIGSSLAPRAHGPDYTAHRKWWLAHLKKLEEEEQEIEPEAAEIIEAKAVQTVDLGLRAAPKDVKRRMENVGIAYREAYREVYLELVREIRQARADEEDEEEAIAMALLF